MPHDNRGIPERPEKAQKAKKAKASGDAPEARKDFPFRHNRWLQPRNRKTPQMFTAFKLPEGLILKNRNVFEVRDLARYGRIPVFSEHVEDLETLIRILGTIEKYKNITPFDKDWDPDTPSWEVYSHILSRIESAIGNFYDRIEWEGQESEWQISNANGMSYILFAEPANHIDNEGYFLFLSFLPKLRRKNKPLFDLFMILLAGIDKQMFPIFSLDYMEDIVEQEINYIEESTCEVSGEDRRAQLDQLVRLKRSSKKFDSGIIHRYHMLVRSISYSNHLFKQKINKFRARKRIEKDVLQWCTEGLKLLSIKDNWSDHMYTCKANRDDQYMDFPDKFAVLWDDQDPFWTTYFESRNELSQQVPVEQVYNLTGYFPDHVEVPKDPEYMYKFTRFFENGREIVRKICKYLDHD